LTVDSVTPRRLGGGAVGPVQKLLLQPSAWVLWTLDTHTD
jgi:hypothetical protein